MMSLYNISCEKIATYIQNGSYDNSVYRLDSKSSNKIYNLLLEKKNELTDRISLQVAAKFNLSEISFKNFPNSTIYVEILQKSCLKSLCLGNLKNIASFFEDDQKSINICYLLSYYLNEDSRRNLQTLDLSGKEEFSTGWTVKIGHMFPSLTTLSIRGRTLYKKEFLVVCQNFPKLISLDISDTNVQLLFGISYLIHLRELTMQNLTFLSHFVWLDLFHLSGLEFLDISRDKLNKDMKTVRQYVDCGMGLSNLRFLDCSGTDIDDQLVQCLQLSHPKLKQICVFDSVLQRSTIQSAGMMTLNTATLGSSLNCLNYFVARRKEYAVWKCLKEINTHVYNTKDDELNHTNFINCTLRAMNTFSSKNVGDEGIRCLVQISMQETMKMPILERSLALKRLSNFIVDLPSLDSLDRLGFHVAVWQAVFNLLSNFPNDSDCEKIWLAAMGFLQKNHISVYCQTGVLTVLHMCTTIMTQDQLSLFAEKRPHMLQLFLALNWSLNKKEHNLTRCIMHIIHYLTKSSYEACKYLEGINFVSVLLDCMRSFNNDQINVQCLAVMVNLARHLEYKCFGIKMRLDFYIFFSASFCDTKKESTYYGCTYIALLLISSEKQNSNCWYWDDANDLLMENCSNYLPSSIAHYYKHLITLDFLHDILKTTKGIGLILWALSTIRIYLRSISKISRQFKCNLIFTITKISCKKQFETTKIEEVGKIIMANYLLL